MRITLSSLCLTVSLIFPQIAWAGTLPINVPFKKQLLAQQSYNEASWKLTRNCGQTSVLMVTSFYSGNTPTDQQIKNIDEFLESRFGDSKREYFGNYTNGDRLVAVAHELGFATAETSAGRLTIDDLKAELARGHVPIVGVWTNMTIDHKRNPINRQHWMVLTGITDIVYVNDPGHTFGKDNKYSLETFEAAWRDQGRQVVLIKPNTASISLNATLDGSTWTSGASSPTSFSLQGPAGTMRFVETPATVRNIPIGTYTLTFDDGGPSNSSLVGIAPCGVLTRGPTCGAIANAGQALAFTLQFATNLQPNQSPTAGFLMSLAGQVARDKHTLNLTVPRSSNSTVLFDGSGLFSTDPDGTISHWRWFINSTEVATNPVFSWLLPKGLHIVTLVVTDNRGATATATGRVLVDEGPPTVTFTEYPARGYQQMAKGPDGALWFAGQVAGVIGRIRVDGVVTEYALPDVSSHPIGISAGPDGAMWFTEWATSKIGRIDPNGNITEYQARSGAELWGIVPGADGALWFPVPKAGLMGRITTSGVLAEYPLPTANSTPQIITTSPTGMIWFTESTGNKVGRIDPSVSPFSVVEFNVPAFPFGITSGPDGAIWFTLPGVGKIGRLDDSGNVRQFSLPESWTFPYYITEGPDGALWFTELGGNRLGRITTAGVISEYPIPTRDSNPTGIAIGEDGAIWLVESQGGKIARGSIVFP
jgi:virginiamycin B lyase